MNTSVDFLITILLAFILHLLFEGPAMRILEILENGKLFKGTKQLQGTNSVEKLKPENGNKRSSKSSLNNSPNNKVKSSSESNASDLI